MAETGGKNYLILFMLEPSVFNYPDTSDRHLQFQYGSLKAMDKVLEKYNRKVRIVYGEAVDILSAINKEYNIENIFSYQESGTVHTWDRDKKIAMFCSDNNIKWTEYQRDGIKRGLKNRSGWDKMWFKRISEPIVENTYSIDMELNSDWESQFQLPRSFEKKISEYDKRYQPPGESFAWNYLNSFLAERGKNYSRHISKPGPSRKSSGRLSPYLAWGNISIKQAYQYVKNHENYGLYKRPYSNFLTRLKWHCHFIQKFEMEPEYELYCINRGYETLVREDDDSKLKAWMNGTTGYPMVDACMRATLATGWINFRMRAMLVSFLCHHLDQDWRRGVYHLAKAFLDYEPGIHYPQFQMQAGTTGINTVRIYNPVKQGEDHDPDGEFIKKWVPELADVPKEFIHTPWKMTELDYASYDIKAPDYPEPIIDYIQEARKSRITIYNHRKNEEVIKESARILATHTRPGKRWA
jgi:deoxyribodipyrimidine photo-lyase